MFAITLFGIIKLSKKATSRFQGQSKTFCENKFGTVEDIVIQIWEDQVR